MTRKQINAIENERFRKARSLEMQPLGLDYDNPADRVRFRQIRREEKKRKKNEIDARKAVIEFDNQIYRYSRDLKDYLFLKAEIAKFGPGYLEKAKKGRVDKVAKREAYCKDEKERRREARENPPIDHVFDDDPVAQRLRAINLRTGHFNRDKDLEPFPQLSRIEMTRIIIKHWKEGYTDQQIKSYYRHEWRTMENVGTENEKDSMDYALDYARRYQAQSPLSRFIFGDPQ
jgi:hypothetical protein